MRNLKIERMRNAGALADRDLLLSRVTVLQERVQELKRRLRGHEPVDDRDCDRTIES